MIEHRDFSTESYLTASYENSSTKVKSKCKRFCIYSSGLCLLVGSWGLFFMIGYQYHNYDDYDNSMSIEEI